MTFCSYMTLTLTMTWSIKFSHLQTVACLEHRGIGLGINLGIKSMALALAIKSLALALALASRIKSFISTLVNSMANKCVYSTAANNRRQV